MDHDIPRRAFLKSAPAAASFLALAAHEPAPAPTPEPDYPEIGSAKYTPIDYPIRAKRFLRSRPLPTRSGNPRSRRTPKSRFPSRRSARRCASGGLSGNVLEAAIYSLADASRTQRSGAGAMRASQRYRDGRRADAPSNDVFEVAVAWYKRPASATLLDPAISDRRRRYMRTSKSDHPPFSGGERDAINCLQLYRVTHDKKHLDLAKHYLDIRGLRELGEPQPAQPVVQAGARAERSRRPRRELRRR